MGKKAPHDAASKEKILARLRSIEGHLRHVVEMVESDEYCIDVLQQTSAVGSALAKVETLLLDRHVDHCVATAIRSGEPSERERVMRELSDVYRARRR